MEREAYAALLERAAIDFPALFGGKPVPLVGGALHLFVAAWQRASAGF
jgi:hypothetical protein